MLNSPLTLDFLDDPFDLLPALPSGLPPLTDSQDVVCSDILDALRDTLTDLALVGPAGTGKTTLLGHLLRTVPGASLAAPTNKAARVLAEKTGREVSTLHRLLGLRPEIDPRTGTQVFLPDPNLREPPLALFRPELLVVDEASMVSSELLTLTRKETVRYGIPVLWVGDDNQLPPVGEPSSPALSCPQVFRLTEVLRHSGSILAYATNSREAPGLLRPPPEFRCPDVGVLISELANSWNPENPDAARAVAWTNAAVREITFRVHQTLHGENAPPWIPGTWAVADKPLVYAGSRTLARPTSWEGRVTEVSKSSYWGIPCWELELTSPGWAPLNVRALAREGFEAYQTETQSRKEAALGESTPWKRKKAWGRYYEWVEAFAALSPAYALTVHKAQGSTYRNLWVHGGDIARNPDPPERKKCYYTAITRAAETLRVVL